MSTIWRRWSSTVTGIGARRVFLSIDATTLPNAWPDLVRTVTAVSALLLDDLGDDPSRYLRLIAKIEYLPAAQRTVFTRSVSVSASAARRSSKAAGSASNSAVKTRHLIVRYEHDTRTVTPGDENSLVAIHHLVQQRTQAPPEIFGSDAATHGVR